MVNYNTNPKDYQAQNATPSLFVLKKQKTAG